MFARLMAVFAVVLTAAAVSTAHASAATAADCQTQLSQLRADTVAAQGSFTNAKDFNGALAKLDAAAGKLAEGKNADAAVKVGDFQSLLAALATAPKPKLDPSVAETLSNEAQGAIDCINSTSS